MAELPALNAIGAIPGDTFEGRVLKHIQADGTYIWRPDTTPTIVRNQDKITALETQLAAAVDQADIDAIQDEIDALEAAEAAELPTLARVNDLTAEEAARIAADTAQDALIGAKADQTALDAEIAATDAEQTAQDAAIALKADQADLDAEIASTDAEQTAQDALIAPLVTQDPLNKAHIADMAIHVLAGGNALQVYRRTADGLGYEWSDPLTISPQNLVAGPGTPDAGVGADGDYYEQFDAALGTNDIWGPKAAGAWPAQADFKSADPEETTATQAVSTTGTDYTTSRTWAVERLDQWGQSRRVQRVFDSGPLFDYPSLNYADKTAIFIRNTDNANGINVDAGAGVTIDVTLSDGTKQSVVQTANMQPGEIGVFEKDGLTARLNIFPGERVKRFANYLAANTFGALPHDGLVLITDTQEIWARKSAVNGASFPADGVENADWGIYGGGDFVQQGTTAEKNALGVVPSNTPFFDMTLGQLHRYATATDVFTVTKAATDLPALVEFGNVNSVFSAMQFKITTSLADTVDNPTITLPDGQDTLLYIIAQQFFNGSSSTNTLGGGFTVRNDGGVLTLVSVEPNRHWGSGLDWNTIPYTAIPNAVAGGIDITLADVNAIFANVPGTGSWVNLDGSTPIVAAVQNWAATTAYAVGDKVVAPMPINANFIGNDGAQVGVSYIFEANTARPDTVTAFDDAEADSGAWDLIGLFRVNGTDDRVITSAGIFVLDPLTTLSNAAVNEYIRWATADNTTTARFAFNPAFITVWKDYTGTGLVQPVAVNDDVVIPANSQMVVHRAGNAVQVMFFSNTSTGFVVDDQAASGYMDVGTMRMQWGDGTSAIAGTQVFPQPFGSTPVVTATTTQHPGHNLSILSRSTTQFTWDQWDVNNTQQSGAWNWIAIGVKP